jgi:ActR/RegA family two-component response regulator
MSGNESVKGGRVKLLLVDDEEAYVSILSKRLAKRNFEVLLL